MQYRLIAIDLDDSLLHHDLSISDRNRRAIREAVKRGVTVTIATGRMFGAARPFIETLGLNVPVITYQGGMIINSETEEILYHCPVPLKEAREIVTLAEQKQVYAQVYLNDRYYFREESQYSELYFRLSGIRGTAVGSLQNFLQQPPTKVLYIDDPSRIQELSTEMKAYFSSQLEIAISKANYLEFTHPEATKGKALAYLVSHLGISQESVMAIGDSFNDISMLEYAGLGVAMGNAREEIRKKADFVTASNDEDGVALAIEKFILNG